MAKEIVNIPKKSTWIGRMFLTITLAVATVFASVSYLVAAESAAEFYFITTVMIGVMSMMLITTIGFYLTKYMIKNNVLTSWSPFVYIKINLKDVKSVEKVLFPFGFRVGASLYSGFYYVPNLGWARVVITNLKDIILIKTKDGRKYMISPKNPKRFMKLLLK
ncbi:MAG: hypothetical protein JW700_01660 [Candidatus Aenigmarchaeota archaeon]|nr:hypothetical protein [Candidatus Aenigmarchaeota archaeon]